MSSARRAQDINPQLVARLSQRLFFVVNKVDLMRTSEGLEPEEIKEYVAALVTSQLATEGFQLLPDQVNPVSSPGAVVGVVLLDIFHSLIEPINFALCRACPLALHKAGTQQQRARQHKDWLCTGTWSVHRTIRSVSR